MTEKTEWKVLTFRDNEDVPQGSVEERTAHIRARAMAKFGLKDAEIDAGYVPSHPGVLLLRNIENGSVEKLHVFEMQISPAAGARITAQHHPDVLLVSDAIPPETRGMGARDPHAILRSHKPPRLK